MNVKDRRMHQLNEAISGIKVCHNLYCDAILLEGPVPARAECVHVSSGVMIGLYYSRPK